MAKSVSKAEVISKAKPSLIRGELVYFWQFGPEADHIEPFSADWPAGTIIEITNHGPNSVEFSKGGPSREDLKAGQTTTFQKAGTAVYGFKGEKSTGTVVLSSF